TALVVTQTSTADIKAQISNAASAADTLGNEINDAKADSSAADTPMTDLKTTVEGTATAAEAVNTAMGQVPAAAQAAGTAFSTAMSDMGSSITTTFKTALDAIPGLWNDMFTALKPVIVAGVSMLADTLYQNLINRIKDALDAEANAS